MEGSGPSTTRTPDDRTLVRYLLGDLPEDRQRDLEAQFFADDRVHDELRAIEDELAYDYAQERLTPEDRARYEQRFLATREGRDKVQAAAAVLQRLAGAHRSPQVDRRVEWPRRWMALTAAAALVMAAGGGWLVIETVRLRHRVNDLAAAIVRQPRDTAAAQVGAAELDRERTRRIDAERQLAARGQSQPPKPLTTMALVLAPGLTRGAEGARRILISPAVDQVQVRLVLQSVAQFQRYRVVVRTVEGKEVWSEDLVPDDRPAALTVTVPARLLPEADYEIEVSGLRDRGAPESVAEFYFTALRP